MEVVYIVWASIIVTRGVMRQTNYSLKRQLVIVGAGTIAFLIFFSLGNFTLVFELDPSYEQYKLFGMPILLALMTYSIIKFKTFNTKLIAAQALVVSLGLLTLSLLFLQTLLQIKIVAALTFLLVCAIGYILVRNVRNEIRQRERIEKLAKDLESANQRLRELDREKTEFVSIASHQLRAPITAIKGYSSLLLEKSYGEIPEKMEQPITNIFESSRLMVNTIEDFLNVSRIELGRMNFAMEDFDLIGISRKVVEELTNNAKLKDLALSFSTREGSVMVHADLNKIKQVVTNFVDNAIKYTQKGSIEVIVSADRVKNKALIAVKDTGMGLDKSTIDELFDKFTRARNANQVNTTGTGLGLYVGKQLIQGHNGRVWVESEGQGKGSTFFIELPLKKNTESGI
jgi:signal transduction histidine kinase